MYEVVASPDGKSVYAVSITDHALVVYERNTTTGALKYKRCIDDDDTGPDDCEASNPGLAFARSVAVSPDGTSVYVVAADDAAIVHYRRIRPRAITNCPVKSVVEG